MSYYKLDIIETLVKFLLESNKWKIAFPRLERFEHKEVSITVTANITNKYIKKLNTAIRRSQPQQ